MLVICNMFQYDRIEVKSKSWDARIALDGKSTEHFPEGRIAIIECLPEDDIVSAQLTDSRNSKSQLSSLHPQ
jgi:hypothetical protein